MRVVVTGGRDFTDREWVEQILQCWPITELIHGGARGADALCAQYALRNRLKVREFLPDWERHGRSAGPIRNRQMLDEQPDAVIAFPGGRGTQDLVRAARERGIQIIVAADTVPAAENHGWLSRLAGLWSL